MCVSAVHLGKVLAADRADAPRPEQAEVLLAAPRLIGLGAAEEAGDDSHPLVGQQMRVHALLVQLAVPARLGLVHAWRVTTESPWRLADP